MGNLNKGKDMDILEPQGIQIIIMNPSGKMVYL